MKKSSPTLMILLVFMIALSACSPAASTPPRDPSQPVLDHDAAPSYSSEFHILFVGPSNWSYQLKTRKSPSLREISLHIEGLTGAQNPGDVRMVTDNTTTWMSGPGTDDQCVQFPNGQGMDPTYIYPESLVSLPALGAALTAQGEQQMAGAAALHFGAAGAASGAWKNATVDFWQDKASGMLRQFHMTASGKDPFFNSGEGQIEANYTTGELGSNPIAAVTGCEISVPLPSAISKYVRLPGMASFESKSSIADLVKFYQSALPGQKWAEKDPPAQANGGTVLSYQRNTESVEIHVEAGAAGGSAVKLLFIQGQ